MNRVLKLLIGLVLVVVGVVLFVMHFTTSGNELIAGLGVPDFAHWLAASFSLFIGIGMLISGLRDGRSRPDQA